ncbi:chromosome partition protein Smc-like [Salvelinus fontinalis]|uniref:chromosome partition protein Smc-like n=1 Tax=Salvelinus fontinalis TaxID=8038 RepID=UPI002486A598|nr:chromosome partition protein Smc-like [Salvelinus fontinalis]
MALETRLGRLDGILSYLHDQMVLNDEEREEVVNPPTKSRTKQNQTLLDMVVRKGDHAQEHFYHGLKKEDPYLVKDLEEKKSRPEQAGFLFSGPQYVVPLLGSGKREIEKLQKTIKQKNKELQEVKACIKQLHPKVRTDNQTQTEEDNDPQLLRYEAINKDNRIEELSGIKAQLEKELRTAEEELKRTEGKWRRTEEELKRTNAELEEQLRTAEEELRRTKEELEKAKKAEGSKKTTELFKKRYKELNRKFPTSYCNEETHKKNIKIDRPYEMTQRSFIASSANPSTPTGQAFITKHKTELVNRLGLLSPILMRLQVQRVLSQEEMEEVESKPTRSKQNLALLNMVVPKGAVAQEYFYQALRESDLLLVEDLCNCRK